MTCRKHNLLNIEDLNPNLLHFIYTYLDRLNDLLSLADTCKFMRQSVFHDRIWLIPLQICIDKNCFGCGMIPIFRIKTFSLLKNLYVENVRIHLDLKYLNEILIIVANNSKIKKLNLNLRNVLLSKVPNIMGLVNFRNEMFLTELTIFGWPIISSRSELNNCKQILQMMGKNLETLQFKQSSPYDSLQAINEFCPNLINLSLEGKLELQDLINLNHSKLKILSLRGTRLRLNGVLNLPNLVRFEFINDGDFRNSSSTTLLPTLNVWTSSRDVHNAVNAIPESVRELDFMIDSRYINEFIVCVSKKLIFLENFSVQISKNDDEIFDVSLNAIQNLLLHCKELNELAILGGLVGFEMEAFRQIHKFLKLRKLTLLYDEQVVDELPDLLNQSSSLKEILFFINSSDLDYSDEEENENESGDDDINNEPQKILENEDIRMRKWNKMEERLSLIAENFKNNEVAIQLVDHWCN